MCVKTYSHALFLLPVAAATVAIGLDGVSQKRQKNISGNADTFGTPHGKHTVPVGITLVSKRGGEKSGCVCVVGAFVCSRTRN